MKFFLTLALCCTAVHACSAINAANILGKDLGAASPAFTTLEPALVVGAAPLPGVRRIFHSSELARIAKANGIELSTPIPEVCFERTTMPLTVDQLLPVLESALALDGAKIEILNFSHTEVPPGALEFSRSGLSAAGVWRGHIKYDGNITTPVWANVRVTTEQTWIEAAAPLASGKPIDVTGLILRTGPRFPFGPAPVATADLAIGLVPIRAIRSGEPILLSMLTTPHAVERGEKVAVEVRSGAARLSFDAIAESSGRKGESVLIKNPENGRYFQARIEGNGKVIVTK